MLIPRRWRSFGSVADLGCAFMCGYPFIKSRSRPQALAAPVPVGARYGGRAVYATDFVVRADSRFQDAADTFGGRLGYTAESSHSGFNAVTIPPLAVPLAGAAAAFSRKRRSPAHAAARDRSACSRGRSMSARSTATRSICMRRHDPDFAAKVRVIESTALAPAPLLVASADCPDDVVARLRASLVAFDDAQLAEALCLAGFAPVDVVGLRTVFCDWERAAETAGYSCAGLSRPAPHVRGSRIAGRSRPCCLGAVDRPPDSRRRRGA